MKRPESMLETWTHRRELIISRATTRSRSKYFVSPPAVPLSTPLVAASVVQVLISSTKNKYNERPIDLLPPSYPGADPESDDEKIRSAIRKAEAEAALGDRGDVVDGTPFLTSLLLYFLVSR